MHLLQQEVDSIWGNSGELEVQRELGTGGCGKVVQVVQLATQYVCALKYPSFLIPETDWPANKRRQIKELDLHKEYWLRQFRVEMSILERFSDLAASVAFSGKNKRKTAFLCQGVQGVRLADLNMTHKIPTIEKVELFLPVLDLLAHMQDGGYFHNDLRLRNLILSENRAAGLKLIDFGLAFHFENNQVPGMKKRTGAYSFAFPNTELQEREPFFAASVMEVYDAAVTLVTWLIGMLRDTPFELPPPSFEPDLWAILAPILTADEQASIEAYNQYQEQQPSHIWSFRALHEKLKRWVSKKKYGLSSTHSGLKKRTGTIQAGTVKRVMLREGVELKLRWIPPFPSGKNRDMQPGFWMGETPLTQKQWHAITPWNSCKFRGPEYPVDSVSYTDIQEFIAKLNMLEMVNGVFCLPSCAQWEWACLAGGSGTFASGGELTSEQANFYGSGDHEPLLSTNEVGLYPENGWGLYDCHGNVREWCQDEFELQGPEYQGHKFRQQKGGSWQDPASRCAASFSTWDLESERRDYYGFRLVLASF